MHEISGVPAGLQFRCATGLGEVFETEEPAEVNETMPTLLPRHAATGANNPSAVAECRAHSASRPRTTSHHHRASPLRACDELDGGVRHGTSRWYGSGRENLSRSEPFSASDTSTITHRHFPLPPPPPPPPPPPAAFTVCVPLAVSAGVVRSVAEMEYVPATPTVAVNRWSPASACRASTSFPFRVASPENVTGVGVWKSRCFLPRQSRHPRVLPAVREAVPTSDGSTSASARSTALCRRSHQRGNRVLSDG